MATYPIRMLKDENGQPFVPICGTNSMVYDDQTTLQEKLDQKVGSDNLVAGNGITITQDDINLVISADLPDMDEIETNISSLNSDVSALQESVGDISSTVSTLETSVSDLSTNLEEQQEQIDTINSNLDNKLEVSNIQAGDNITISTSGNDVTIAAQVPTPATNYYGTETPSDTLGNNGDLYILIESE